LRTRPLESTILVGIGCLDGAILGVYGHALASRWLSVSVGFPAPFSLGLSLIILTVGIVTFIALVVVAVPGVLAARVSPSISLQD
jgi:putative ABC transport system permease protein